MCPPVMAILPAVATIASAGAAVAGGIISSNQQKKAIAAQRAAQEQATDAIRKSQTNVTQNVQRTAQTTASQLKDNKSEKRTISSLRIPLNQQNSNTGINTGNNNVGLNIPI